MQNTKRSFGATAILIFFILVLGILFNGACTWFGPCEKNPGWLKVEEPPDVDKVSHHGEDRPTCWMATAANLLAAAGYAKDHPDIDVIDPKTAQDLIYRNMLQLLDVTPGFAHTALETWLEEHQANYPDILYRWPYVVGDLGDPPPGSAPTWQNPEGPMELGNLMRECNLLGIAIYRVENTSDPDNYWAHAISLWGDEAEAEFIENNPNTIRVTDSDRTGNSIYDEYSYDDYNEPNPGHDNLGEGWYLNYHEDSHPYIKHYYVLSELEFDNGDDMIAGMVGEYMMFQSNESSAQALSYQIGSDSTILKKDINLLSSQLIYLPLTPEITPEAAIPTKYDVNWDLSTDPMPEGSGATASTLMVLPLFKPMEFSKVHFVHEATGEKSHFPGIKWYIKTEFRENPRKSKNVTGGYIVGHFDIVKETENGTGQEKVGEYRFVQQYRYNQKPETFTFFLSGTSNPAKYYITNLKFGHSYGLLTGKKLWKFSEWKTLYDPNHFEMSPTYKAIPIVWPTLHYPRGMDSTKKIS